MIPNTTPMQTLGKACKYCKVLGRADWRNFRWKAIRKGRATHLVKDNINLPTLLAIGEWPTPAMLRYIDEDACDRALFVNNIAYGSDDEMEGNFGEVA